MDKRTTSLKVIGDVSIPVNRLVVNPNDGYDLGLMNSAHPVKLHGCTNLPDGSTNKGYIFDGQLVQQNDCNLGTVVISMKLLSQLGKPKSVLLSMEENRLSIVRIE
jgi:hypothetical protein